MERLDFGTGSALYIAIRTLHEIAKQNEVVQPLVAYALRK